MKIPTYIMYVDSKFLETVNEYIEYEKYNNIPQAINDISYNFQLPILVSTFIFDKIQNTETSLDCTRICKNYTYTKGGTEYRNERDKLIIELLNNNVSKTQIASVLKISSGTVNNVLNTSNYYRDIYMTKTLTKRVKEKLNLRDVYTIISTKKLLDLIKNELMLGVNLSEIKAYYSLNDRESELILKNLSAETKTAIKAMNINRKFNNGETLDNLSTEYNLSKEIIIRIVANYNKLYRCTLSQVTTVQ